MSCSHHCNVSRLFVSTCQSFDGVSCRPNWSLSGSDDERASFCCKVGACLAKVLQMLSNVCLSVSLSVYSPQSNSKEQSYVVNMHLSYRLFEYLSMEE